MEVVIVATLGIAALLTPVITSKPNPGMVRIGWALLAASVFIWWFSYA